MRFSRARYVTLCQQSLVTAAVLAVGLSAAGVRTLDIVPQPGTTVRRARSRPRCSRGLVTSGTCAAYPVRRARRSTPPP